MTVTSFHHVGIVTRELQTSTQIYERLGYTASGRYDDPIQKVAIILMRRSDSPMIELILPTESDSPAAGWLKRVKAGPYHTCYEVPALAEAMDLFKANGFTALHDPVPAVAFEMRPIVFLWSAEVGLVELLQG
jgi:methylmalonyl-CoA/ethylmalonyl-CoA epimerase